MKCHNWKFVHFTYDSDRWFKTHVYFRPVRCSWEREHVKHSKWHCAESTGHVWLVKDKERR